MNKNVEYVCDVCKDNFPAIEGQCNNYCRVSSLESSFMCAKCSRRFSMGYEVADMESSSNGLKNPCEHADIATDECLESAQVLRLEYELESNLPNKSNERPYACNVCPSSFKNQRNLTRHMNKHKEPNPFICDLCNKNFYCNSTLKKHKEKHTEERPHECPICHSTYKARGTLNAHMKKFNENNPFKCEICNHSFENELALERHIGTHNRKRYHKCSVCPKSYKHIANLNKHMKIHDKQNLLDQDCEHKTNC